MNTIGLIIAAHGNILLFWLFREKARMIRGFRELAPDMWRRGDYAPLLCGIASVATMIGVVVYFANGLAEGK